MVEADAAPFVALLREVTSLYPNAKPLTEGQVAMFFRALAEHSLAAVRAGMDAHVKDAVRGRFPPVPADVIAQIEAAVAVDGRPGADEAWAIALRAMDESATVVWSQEISIAWGQAKSVLDLGDEVGGRMAFKDAYNRLVQGARARREPCLWHPSLGTDLEQRNVAIEQAVAIGRLNARDYPALPAPAARGEETPLLGLVGDLAGKAPPGHRERLLAIRAELAKRGPVAEAESADAEAKRLTTDRKFEAAQKVLEYLGAHPEACVPARSFEDAQVGNPGAGGEW